MFENYNVTMFNRKGMLYLQYLLDGKQKQKSTRLKDTKQNRKLVQTEVIPKFILALKSGQLSKEKPKEFSFYAEKWLFAKESLKSYREFYGILFNQLYPAFKSNKINEITRGDIKEFIDDRLHSVSPNRARLILNCIKAIFEIALEYEHIEKNPASAITLPTHHSVRQMSPFTKEEVNILLKNAKGWFRNYLAVAFFTGARHGEILALTWSDVDFEKMHININKRVKKNQIDTPKTKSSIRKVPIFKPLVPYLKEQYELCKKHNSMNVFYNPNTNKAFSDTKKLSQFWYVLLEEVGFERRVFYNTRHTFVTQMIRAGVPILDVSQTVGHKSIEETISTYAKFLPDEHLKLSRDINPFTDSSTDSKQEKTYT